MWIENHKHDIKDRVLKRAIRRENGCLEYGGNNPTKHKYGLISITVDGNRKNVPAHRALYMALNDCFDLPRSVVIRHKCDNSRCVEESHLLPGTHKSNSDDKFERGRNAKIYRKHKRLRVHNDEKILAIRNAIGLTKTIAEIHGVSIGYVSKIRNGIAKSLVV